MMTKEQWLDWLYLKESCFTTIDMRDREKIYDKITEERSELQSRATELEKDFETCFNDRREAYLKRGQLEVREEELAAEVVEAKLILLEAKKLTECALTAQAGDWIAVEPTFTKIRNFIASPTGTDLLAKMERMEIALKTFSQHGVRHDTTPTNAHLWDVTKFYDYLRSIDTFVRCSAQQALDAGKESK